jgi:hypothetical protein
MAGSRAATQQEFQGDMILIPTEALRTKEICGPGSTLELLDRGFKGGVIQLLAVRARARFRVNDAEAAATVRPYQK